MNSQSQLLCMIWLGNFDLEYRVRADGFDIVYPNLGDERVPDIRFSVTVKRTREAHETESDP
jgi:hypothetical protein